MKTCLWYRYKVEHVSSKPVECGLKGVTIATHVTRYWLTTSPESGQPVPSNVCCHGNGLQPAFYHLTAHMFDFVGIPQTCFRETAESPRSLQLQTCNLAHSTGNWMGYMTVSRVFRSVAPQARMANFNSCFGTTLEYLRHRRKSMFTS